MVTRTRAAGLAAWTLAVAAMAAVLTATSPSAEPIWPGVDVWPGAEQSVGPLQIYAACWVVGLVAIAARRRLILTAAGLIVAIGAVVQLTARFVPPLECEPERDCWQPLGAVGFLWLGLFVLLLLGLLYLASLGLEGRRARASRAAIGMICATCGTSGLRAGERCPVCGADEMFRVPVRD